MCVCVCQCKPSVCKCPDATLCCPFPSWEDRQHGKSTQALTQCQTIGKSPLILSRQEMTLAVAAFPGWPTLASFVQHSAIITLSADLHTMVNKNPAPASFSAFRVFFFFKPVLNWMNFCFANLVRGVQLINKSLKKRNIVRQTVQTMFSDLKVRLTFNSEMRYSSSNCPNQVRRTNSLPT